LKTINSWLKGRREVVAIEMTREHSKDTVMAMEQLQRCITYAAQGHTNDLTLCYKVLQTKEKEADDLKRRIIAELANGDLPPTEREDLMRLARSIDQVIDWINETGWILIEFDYKIIPDELKSLIEEMVRVIYSCVIKLDECIENLTERKFQDALKAANEVETLEENMDNLYGNGRRLIGRLDGSTIGIGSAILISQFIDSLENIADRCELTCDEVRVIAITFPI